MEVATDVAALALMSLGIVTVLKWWWKWFDYLLRLMYVPDSGRSQAASPAACTCDMYLNRTLVHLTSCPLAPKTSNPTEGG